MTGTDLILAGSLLIGWGAVAAHAAFAVHHLRSRHVCHPTMPCLTHRVAGRADAPAPSYSDAPAGATWTPGRGTQPPHHPTEDPARDRHTRHH